MPIKSMQEVLKRVIFSDVNPDVLIEGPFELTFNEASITKSLDTCFTTPKYSRVFRRRFGSRLLNLLFQPMNEATASAIGSELKDVAEQWENRITDIEVAVIPDYMNQTYFVEVTYTIPLLGNKMVSYTFNLNQGASS